MHQLPSILRRLLIVLLLSGLLGACSKKDNRAQFLEAAKKFFDAGEYENAKAEYMKVLRQDAANVPALTQLGIIWMNQGSPRRAAPFLVEMSSRAPTDVAIRTRTLQAFIQLQDFGRAYTEASAILKLDPANEEALLFMATSARTAEQIQTAKQVIASFPAKGSAAYHAAMAPLLLGDKTIPEAERLTAAEKAVRAAVAANPRSLAAHVALAKICLLKKNDFEAEDEFKIVSKLAPLRSPERLNFAAFKSSHGAVPEARALVDEVTRQAGDYLPAWVLSAKLAVAAKSNEEAKAMLQKVTDIDSENYEARMLQAQILSTEKKADEAIVILENLLKIYPGQPGAQYYLATAWVQKGDAGKALPLLTQAVQASPDFAEAALLLAGLNLQRGQSEEAISGMRALLKLRPGLVSAILMEASAYQASGRFSEGIDLLKKLVKEVPRNPQFWQQLGTMHRQAKQPGEARQAFEEVLKLAPDNLGAVSQLVEIDIAEKKYEAAHSRLKSILEKTPESTDANALEGRIFAEEKKWEEAEAAFQKSIAANPENLAAYQSLIQVYVDAKRLPRALEQANLLLAKHPDNQSALLMSALICEEQRSFPAARDYYEKLLAIKPGIPDVMNNLACLYLDHLNDDSKAYALALEASKLSPPPDPSAPLASRIQSSAIAETLGWTQYKRGQYKEAFELLRGAARVITGNPHVQYHYGMAAAMMGEIETARAALAAAIKPGTGLPEDSPARAAIQARLDLIGGSETPSKSVPVADIEQAARKEPNDPFVQFLLASGREKEKDFPGAASAYQKALELNPAQIPSMIALARLNAGPLKNPARALELAKSARQLNQEDPVIAGALGGIALDAGDHSWAYDLLSQGKRAQKPDPTVLRNFALASYSMGKVAEARENTQRLLTDFPESPHAAEAKTFLAMTDPALDEKAVTGLLVAAEATLQSDPGNVPALMIRARNQALKGETAPAIATASAILTKSPNFTPAQIQLASFYAQEPGTREKAWELATKARAVLPNDPVLIRTLAALSYHKKDYPYVIQLLETSARTEPLTAEDLYYLGAAQFSIGDKPASRKSLRAALAGRLPEPLSSHAGQMLEKLGPE